MEKPGLGDIYRFDVKKYAGWLFASPRAVMNAWYLSILRTPRRTDVGAINHIYNYWPR